MLVAFKIVCTSDIYFRWVLLVTLPPFLLGNPALAGRASPWDKSGAR